MARNIMKDNSEQWRAVALWTNAATGAVVEETVVGPYSTARTAKGSLTHEIGGRYGMARQYENAVSAGTVLFERWVEKADIVWRRV